MGKKWKIKKKKRKMRGKRGCVNGGSNQSVAATFHQWTRIFPSWWILPYSTRWLSSNPCMVRGHWLKVRSIYSPLFSILISFILPAVVFVSNFLSRLLFPIIASISAFSSSFFDFFLFFHWKKINDTQVFLLFLFF